MGWLGTLFVGAVVGYWGAVMMGVPGGRHRLTSMVIAAVCALLAKMLGNITALFEDGASLEWLVSVAVAIAATLAFSRWVRR